MGIEEKERVDLKTQTSRHRPRNFDANSATLERSTTVVKRCQRMRSP